MPIWHGNSGSLHPAHVAGRSCPYCTTELSIAGEVLARWTAAQADVVSLIDGGAITALVCPACGWWRLEQSLYGTFGPADPFSPNDDGQRELAAVGTLINLDLLSDDAPLREVREYLVARWASRGSVHPRVFEETTASVFRDIGFSCRVTAYSGDGGIDVILDGPGGKTIGVQVKRQANSVGVEAIRALVGAIVLGRHCAGIFVTTSDFTRGSRMAAEQVTRLGLPVSLVEGMRFYEAMRLANIATAQEYNLAEPPFSDAELTTYLYRAGFCQRDWESIWEPGKAHPMRGRKASRNEHGAAEAR